jgi:hypothetical protein
MDVPPCGGTLSIRGGRQAAVIKSYAGSAGAVGAARRVMFRASGKGELGNIHFHLLSLATAGWRVGTPAERGGGGVTVKEQQIDPWRAHGGFLIGLGRAQGNGGPLQGKAIYSQA